MAGGGTFHSPFVLQKPPMYDEPFSDRIKGHVSPVAHAVGAVVLHLRDGHFIGINRQTSPSGVQVPRTGPGTFFPFQLEVKLWHHEAPEGTHWHRLDSPCIRRSPDWSIFLKDAIAVAIPDVTRKATFGQSADVTVPNGLPRPSREIRLRSVNFRRTACCIASRVRSFVLGATYVACLRGGGSTLFDRDRNKRPPAKANARWRPFHGSPAFSVAWACG